MIVYMHCKSSATVVWSRHTPFIIAADCSFTVFTNSTARQSIVLTGSCSVEHTVAVVLLVGF